MAFRDDHAAALARASSLERDLARERKRAEKAERKLAAIKAEAEARARGATATPGPAAPVPVTLPAAEPPAPTVREVPAPRRSLRPWRRPADDYAGSGVSFLLIWLLVFVGAAAAIAAMLAIIG